MDKKCLAESLLFISGHPLSYKKMAEILNVSEFEMEKMLIELSQDYEKNNRGLRLIFLDNKVQMAAAPDSEESVKELVKSDFEEDLSQAALETLAIIAYRGPVSRASIEDLRGVNCSFILQNLVVRGLIEKKGNPLDGRSYIYNIAFDFLKYLGLSRIENLPNYKEQKSNG